MMLLPLSVSMEKDYGMPCSQQICFGLVWMLLTWPKAHNVCVCFCITIDLNFQAVPLNGFCCLETGLGWLSQPCQCRLSLKCPPPQQSPLLSRILALLTALLVSSLTQLLNETPDESVLTNLTWVCGCHIPGEVLSVSWECPEPRKGGLHSSAASFSTSF